MTDLFTVLGAGGDAAMIALFFLMWRFDRRLLKIELHLFNGAQKKKDDPA